MSVKKENLFTRFTTKTSTLLGRPVMFITTPAILLAWGGQWPTTRFLRYLAACYQYRHYYRNVLNGLHYPKYTKPRQPGS